MGNVIEGDKNDLSSVLWRYSRRVAAFLTRPPPEYMTAMLCHDDKLQVLQGLRHVVARSQAGLLRTCAAHVRRSNVCWKNSRRSTQPLPPVTATSGSGQRRRKRFHEHETTVCRTAPARVDFGNNLKYRQSSLVGEGIVPIRFPFLDWYCDCVRYMSVPKLKEK